MSFPAPFFAFLHKPTTCKNLRQLKNKSITVGTFSTRYSTAEPSPYISIDYYHQCQLLSRAALQILSTVLYFRAKQWLISLSECYHLVVLCCAVLKRQRYSLKPGKHSTQGITRRYARSPRQISTTFGSANLMIVIKLLPNFQPLICIT
jgi:hypothetical protein